MIDQVSIERVMSNADHKAMYEVELFLDSEPRLKDILPMFGMDAEELAMINSQYKVTAWRVASETIPPKPPQNWSEVIGPFATFKAGVTDVLTPGGPGVTLDFKPIEFLFTVAHGQNIHDAKEHMKGYARHLLGEYHKYQTAKTLHGLIQPEEITILTEWLKTGGTVDIDDIQTLYKAETLAGFGLINGNIRMYGWFHLNDYGRIVALYDLGVLIDPRDQLD